MLFQYIVIFIINFRSWMIIVLGYIYIFLFQGKQHNCYCCSLLCAEKSKISIKRSLECVVLFCSPWMYFLSHCFHNWYFWNIWFRQKPNDIGDILLHSNSFKHFYFKNFFKYIKLLSKSTFLRIFVWNQ